MGLTGLTGRAVDPMLGVYLEGTLSFAGYYAEVRIEHLFATLIFASVLLTLLPKPNPRAYNADALVL